jgi:predicted esterase
MTLRAVVAAAAAATLLAVSPAQPSLRDELRATSSTYYARMASLAPIVGRDTVVDYLSRLNDDGDLLDMVDVPQGYDAAEWHAYVREIAKLDISLAQQLLTQRYQPMESIRGLGETFVRSSRDGTLQPVAVYVPPSYTPAHPAPLVVFLHGHPQSETSLIAPDYVAKLADSTGSVVVAPYGRGLYDFRGAIDDVYDAVAAANKAFAIDGRHRYLAGYSMGGFSVFEVAPAHPDTWSAIMCIAGALLGHDAHAVVSMLPNTPFYVLTGHDDDSIPTQYPTATAVFLQASGIPVAFYSEPHGIHRLVTLLPILTKAWDDMHHGIVRSPPPVLGNFALPGAPMGSTKP